jgi:hypothetical protein
MIKLPKLKDIKLRESKVEIEKMVVHPHTILSNKRFNFTEEELKIMIIAEKRKREQVYSTMDYVLSFISYFDFFSHDAFTVAGHSKLLAQSVNIKSVTSEFLVYPFLELKGEIKNILLESNLSRATVFHKLPKTGKMFEKQNPIKQFIYRVPMVPYIISLFQDPVEIDNSIEFSHEVDILFEKAAQNAIERFKTPVINAEVLFITLMEERQTRAGKMIKSFIPDDTAWYLLRYRLLKRLHVHEVNIRTEVPKNQRYFAYLLKTQIPELHFDRLIELGVLDLGTLCFRNILIGKILKVDMYKWMEIEVNKSIKLTSTRKYSS